MSIVLSLCGADMSYAELTRPVGVQVNLTVSRAHKLRWPRQVLERVADLSTCVVIL